MSLEGNQYCSQKPATKTKPHKPAFKMARDTLTKKWVFVKIDKLLGYWPLQHFLGIYKNKKLPSASSIETTKLAMLMQS